MIMSYMLLVHADIYYIRSLSVSDTWRCPLLLVCRCAGAVLTHALTAIGALTHCFLPNSATPIYATPIWLLPIMLWDCIVCLVCALHDFWQLRQMPGLVPLTTTLCKACVWMIWCLWCTPTIPTMRHPLSSSGLQRHHKRERNGEGRASYKPAKDSTPMSFHLTAGL